MKAHKKYEYRPDYAVPPGQTLREVMESLEMTQKEFAIRTGLTVQSLNRIFKGEQPISYESANRLELATGTPASFWNNLEAQSQEQKVKVEERRNLEKDLEWLKTIPVKELQDRGILSRTDDKLVLLRETLGFYGVGSVDAWREIWEKPAIAARRSQCFESQPGSASAWIRQGEIQAHEKVCKPFDKASFLKALKKIRSLTKESPEKFEPAMKKLCAGAGVAVSLVREMKKVPWNGATKWITPQKAMILLCLRGKGEDKFWFSFFHEAGHVLNDSKKDLLINDGSKDDPREVRANEFAARFLIPPEYDRHVRTVRSREEVLRLARDLDIAPGIVAGRFQFLTQQWDHYRDIIRTLRWK
ncbi:MAG TPA: helix-turn-helix domain-containing protein [Syntrophorhabdaceae bacterium]|nr:helix-turn-helix domain-containing protein [Syntrophorhabdaceae bacterium]HOW55706.1 helix-turn-helix domain-containing protein [Syntrophorhabdaceae bacterium]